MQAVYNCSCLSTGINKTHQTLKLDLTIVSSIIDGTLHPLDDTMLVAANRVLELLDKMKEATGIKITTKV